MNELMGFFEVIIILLLIVECWVLVVFAKEHSLILDLIRHHLIDIKLAVKDQKSSNQ